MSERRAMDFDRYGRTDQLRLRTAEDLEQVLTLDDSFWVAMSAPVSCLNCDREFLDFVDHDENGRIRANELRTAVQWLFERLADRSRIADGVEELSLSAFDASDAEGRQLLETARYVRTWLGAQGPETISLTQIQTFLANLDKNVINGDGIITAQATEDREVREFIEDVIACMGGHDDRTGQVGIVEEALDQFLNQAQAYLTWAGKGRLAPGEGGEAILPLGEDTLAGYEALRAVRAKTDEFFARCRMIGFSPASADLLKTGGVELDAGALSDADAINAALERLPIAEPNAEGVLPLSGALNPAYAAALQEFRDRAAQPILGRELPQLSQAQWDRVKAAFAPYEQWLAGKRGADVEKLKQEKLRRYLDGPYADAVRAMLAADREVAERSAQVRALKKMLLYHRYLLQLASNFVSFPDLYDPARRAMFEMGSLVIDGRWFNFAVKVEGVQEHSKLAEASRIYVMYVELTRADETDGLVVAVAATSGTAGNLGVGKRGVFYDTRGRLYDARVVHIIENPISFGEALVSPFVRLGRFVRGKIDAFSGAAQKRLESQVGRAAKSIQAQAQEAASEAPAASAGSRRDILIGASLSIAALSSAFAYIASTMAGLLERPFLLVMAVVILALLVFVPTAVIAGSKLARRDLSALLEGCGWAINARMRLDGTQRRQFTRQESYPSAARGVPKARRLTRLLVILLLSLLALVVTWTVL